MRTKSFWLLLTVVALFVAGCGSSTPDTSSGTNGAAAPTGKFESPRTKTAN